MAAAMDFEQNMQRGGGESMSQASSIAALRLAALSQHLAPAFPSGFSVMREACFAKMEQRPASSGGKGTLMVVDNRTGNTYTFEISEGGTVKATDFKKVITLIMESWL
jgi:citrate synthase